MAAEKKPSMGRQKIPMQRIQKESHRQVTFSKRRAGLFKKASELCILCGVQMVIIVFSPAKKAFSFGDPDVDSVIDRYLAGEETLTLNTTQLIQAHRNVNVRELNIHLTNVDGETQNEKRRGEVLDQFKNDPMTQNWWDSSVDELGPDRIEQFRVALEALKQKATEEMNYKFMVESAAATPGFYQYNGNHHELNMNMNMNMSGASSSSSSVHNPHNYGGGYGHGYH